MAAQEGTEENELGREHEPTEVTATQTNAYKLPYN